MSSRKPNIIMVAGRLHSILCTGSSEEGDHMHTRRSEPTETRRWTTHTHPHKKGTAREVRTACVGRTPNSQLHTWASQPPHLARGAPREARDAGGVADPLARVQARAIGSVEQPHVPGGVPAGQQRTIGTERQGRDGASWRTVQTGRGGAEIKRAVCTHSGGERTQKHYALDSRVSNAAARDPSTARW